MKANLSDAQVTILIEVNGQIHLVGMDKEKLDAVNLLTKASAEVIIPTSRSQVALNQFLGYEKIQ